MQSTPPKPATMTHPGGSGPGPGVGGLPHQQASIDEAMARLPGGRRADAALLLALPVGQVPGIHVRTEDGFWHWRGGRAPVAAREAARLVTLGSRDEDRFTDLGTEPLDWIRVLRSGAWLVTFGSDLLLDLPLLRLDPVLTERASAILRRVRDGELGIGGDQDLDIQTITGGWLIRPRTDVAVAL